MNFENIRAQIFDTVQKAVAADLIYLSAGNISARVGDAMAITPAGIGYDSLRPEHIAIIDLHGNPIDAPHKPSSETPMHTHLMRAFPDVNAVVHTHSSYALTFAMLGEPVPPVNLELYVLGAPVPVAPWACPGTEAPGVEATQLFQGNPNLRVVLLRNHGLLAIGSDLKSAFEAAYNAERGMQTYHQALQIGQPATLTPQQIEQIKAVYA